jgi:transcriptional regulator with XRE-family HTH domain
MIVKGANMESIFTDKELELKLGLDIKNMRLAKNISRESLCEKAGISLNALRHLESGSGATIKTLIPVLKILNKVDWLISISPEISINPLNMTKRGKSRKSATKAAYKEKRALGDLEYKRGYLKKYGLTVETYLKMFQSQNGKCGNIGCNEELRHHGHTTHVDHNHTTGEVRSLLCSGCNTSLGFLKENDGRILGLANYIKAHTKE